MDVPAAAPPLTILPSMALGAIPFVLVLERSPLGVYAHHYKTLLDDEEHLPCTANLSNIAQVIYASSMFSADAYNKDRAIGRHDVYKAHCTEMPLSKCVFRHLPSARTGHTVIELPLHALLCLPALCKEAVEAAGAWAKKTVLKDSSLEFGANEYKDIRVWELCGSLCNQILLRDDSVPVHYQNVQVPPHNATLCALVLLLTRAKPLGAIVHLETDGLGVMMPMYDWQVCADEALNFYQGYVRNLEMQKHSRVFTTLARTELARADPVPNPAPDPDAVSSCVASAASTNLADALAQCHVCDDEHKEDTQ